MIVNQWVPAAHRGDAIGDSARHVRKLLHRLGHESEIYALTIDDDMAAEVQPFSDTSSRGGDLTIFHFALPSEMTAAFASLDGGRILQYHNLTPAAFFAPYDASLFRLAALGRQELARLAGSVDLALGDSEYNRRELESLGFGPTGVFPIAVDTSRITRPVRLPALETILDERFVNFLFVGRIAPNKKIEDHIKLAEVYNIPLRSLYSKDVSNLMMAGRNASCSHVAFTSTRVMAPSGKMAMQSPLRNRARHCAKASAFPAVP